MFKKAHHKKLDIVVNNVLCAYDYNVRYEERKNLNGTHKPYQMVFLCSLVFYYLFYEV